MKKIKFKKINGHFYINKYKDSMIIYDQNKNYIDIVYTEHDTEYLNNILTSLKNVNCEQMFYNVLDLDNTINAEYLTTIIKNFESDRNFIIALDDLHTLSERKFCQKYNIYKIGEYYSLLDWGIGDYE